MISQIENTTYVSSELETLSQQNSEISKQVRVLIHYEVTDPRPLKVFLHSERIYTQVKMPNSYADSFKNLVYLVRNSPFLSVLFLQALANQKDNQILASLA